MHDQHTNDYISDISATMTVSNTQGLLMVTSEVDRKGLAKKLAQQSQIK
ncbi:hypothetical protein SAG0136_04400 [Streptococcus agalactiae LMG 14747]|uniref:Uncharacterized protein n=1 Tax=Streptococcus agalactiae LMG 14747 TaxID=1154860 RepID=V6Z0V2_STRAG|nr:hypothetical protein SAG0136_04400 [Streptococcus agalactiae LMG 14747]